MRSLGYLVAFLLGMAAAVAIQGHTQDWIVQNGLAIHFDGRDHCESTTPGLGIEHGDYSAGFYRNSNCRWSAYAAQSWTPLRMGPVRLGSIAGGVSGYGRPITPVAGLVASWEGSRYGMNLIYIPPVGDSGNVLWLQGKVRF